MKSRLVEHLDPIDFSQTYVRTGYSPYALNQVQRILNHGIDDQAINRREVEAITIDGATSLDLDDAVWVERTQNGYCISIHISDVSEAVPLFSPLDIEALKRTTSIYRRDNILDMLPSALSNNTLSLDPIGGKKLTQTLQIEIDDEGKVTNFEFYESRFKNLKRYDYESFGEDFINPESAYYTTLQLLKEVSDRLRMQRLKTGGVLHFNDDNRKTTIGNKRTTNYQNATTRISHDIIESLMVLANTVTGQFLAQQEGVPLLYKRHDTLDEASFYYHKPSRHSGLAVENYTHFTSPIRRYVDIIIHRIIKALHRGDEIPYRSEDTKFVAEHSNNTRWKVEALGKQIDINSRGQAYYDRTREKLGRPLEVYDMKPYIRNATAQELRLPQVMRNSISERIQKGNVGHWIWSAGIILLGKEQDLKEVMRQRIIEDRVMSFVKFLNVIKETQILQGQEPIFQINELKESGCYSISIVFQNKRIVEVKGEYDIQREDMPHMVDYLVRRKVVEDLFEHFM